MAKSAVNLNFSLHPLPVISSPKSPFFVRFGHFGGKNHLFWGVFLFSSREILARNLILRRKNQFDEEFLFGIRPNFDFGRRGKGESRRFFSLPHSTQKIQADFLSKLLHFSRLPPLFHLKPPHHSQIPFHPTRRTRAYAYIRARALSEFAIFAFTLHLTPQQAVYQSVECEGKPCLHLHPQHNNLRYSTLHDIRCKKTGEGKRVKPSPTTHSCSTLYTQKVKR